MKSTERLGILMDEKTMDKKNSFRHSLGGERYGKMRSVWMLRRKCGWHA